ncbi:MAG: lipocalin family protein [Verrucomicrobia bacterium]|nr:lipocalin family protein [Verrucomicrobiota bacterium]
MMFFPRLALCLPVRLSSILSLALLLCCALLTPGCGRAAGRGGLEDGLYLRTAYAFGNLDISTVYLAGDRIAWNPRGGVDPFDFAAAEKNDPKNVGHFKVNGDKLEVTWGGGRAAQSLPLEYDKGQLSALDGGLISKAAAYKKDEHLDAVFSGSIGTANVSAARTLTLTKSGQFTMSALGDVTLPRSTGGGSASSESNTQGTYTLSGNTLTLHFADGKTEKHTVIPFNTALDPAKAKVNDEKLIYDGMSLRRER